MQEEQFTYELKCPRDSEALLRRALHITPIIDRISDAGTPLVFHVCTPVRLTSLSLSLLILCFVLRVCIGDV